MFISDGTPQTFEARFTFHGFRYLRVSGVENPMADQFVAVVLSTEKQMPEPLHVPMQI